MRDKERREDGLISELRVAEAKASSKITNKKKKKKKEEKKKKSICTGEGGATRDETSV